MSVLLTVSLSAGLPLSAASYVDVVKMRTENRVNPLGIGTSTPRFSWQITSDRKGVVQTSYQILVASSREKLDRNEADLWDSGERKSDEQLWIPYQGKVLLSGSEAYWKVRITTNRGKSEWTEPQLFTIGLLGENKWSGTWIGLEDLQPGEKKGMHTRLAARYIRKDFATKGKVKRAVAYVAGLGVYEFYVNGQRMGGSQALQPAPTDYRKTIYYNTFNVTSLLTEKNAIAIKLGNGRMFPMRLEKAYKTPFFGYPKCRINVKVEYENGKTETWATNNTWKLSFDGPIRSNNEYDGEEYDARREQALKGWTQAGFDDSQWQKAERCAIPDGTLMAQPMTGMVEKKFGHPVSLKHRHDTLIVDFGQDMAGWIGFQVRGKQGDTIRVKYAEKLQADGSLYLDNFRNALSEDVYVCNGKENGKLWRPAFSYHGFRYAAITGMKKARKENFTAYTVSDEMATIGHIETSDTILNKVLENAWWGIYSNYKGMPVDCPQRTSASLGWAIEQWVRWVRVSFSTMSDSTASGCPISAMPSVRMATSRMWLLLSGIIIPMMSPGRQPCLSPVICSIISLATSSLSSILIHPSGNGSTISWQNIRIRTASSPRINTATGAYHQRSWN